MEFGISCHRLRNPRHPEFWLSSSSQIQGLKSESAIRLRTDPPQPQADPSFGGLRGTSNLIRDTGYEIGNYPGSHIPNNARTPNLPSLLDQGPTNGCCCCCSRAFS